MISWPRLLLWFAVEGGAAALIVYALLHGDHRTERWLFLVAALALVLVARAFRAVIWFDVLVFALVASTVAVADRAHHAKAKAVKPHPVKPHPVAPVTFALPARELVAEKKIVAHNPGVVILLDPRGPGNGAPVSYAPHRYKVVFCDAVSSPPKKTGKVRVKVKRGTNDSNVSQFAAELAASKQIVVLPPPK